MWRERLFEVVDKHYLVGVQEDFAQVVDWLVGHFGLKASADPRGKINFTRPPVEELPEETRTAIAAYNWLDAELHARYAARFSSPESPGREAGPRGRKKDAELEIARELGNCLRLVDEGRLTDFDHAAARWVGRLCLDTEGFALGDVAIAEQGLAALRSGARDRARELLAELCRRHDLVTAERLVERELQDPKLKRKPPHAKAKKVRAAGPRPPKRSKSL